MFRLKINHAEDSQATCVLFLGSVLVVANKHGLCRVRFSGIVPLTESTKYMYFAISDPQSGQYHFSSPVNFSGFMETPTFNCQINLRGGGDSAAFVSGSRV